MTSFGSEAHRPLCEISGPSSCLDVVRTVGGRFGAGCAGESVDGDVLEACVLMGTSVGLRLSDAADCGSSSKSSSSSSWMADKGTFSSFSASLSVGLDPPGESFDLLLLLGSFVEDEVLPGYVHSRLPLRHPIACVSDRNG